jgi:hypothetical protein
VQCGCCAKEARTSTLTSVDAISWVVSQTGKCRDEEAWCSGSHAAKPKQRFTKRTWPRMSPFLNHRICPLRSICIAS